MAFTDKFAGIKNFLGMNDDRYDEYDEYDDYDDAEYGQQNAPQPKETSEFRPNKVSGHSPVSQRPTAMKVIVIEPKVFEDSEAITNQLRDMRPVLINFENTDPHEAARIVDFVSGATFALDGKLEKVGKDIFMCVPMNISIDYNDKTYTELNEKFAWKEPQL